MKRDELGTSKNTQPNTTLARAPFALSLICLLAALFGPHGLLTSAPTLGGAGSIVGAVVFLLLGVHFRKLTSINNGTSDNSDKT